MLPPPTTIASSRPSLCTSTISRAIRSTVFGSVPYSWSPISASPESFRRTRRNAGAAPEGDRSSSCWGVVTPLFCDREAVERDDTRSRLGDRLTRRLRRVVDPRLLGQHSARLSREEALAEHALDDLLLRLLRLALELVGVEVDLPLGLDRLGRHVLLRQPLGRGERDVHGELTGELLAATLELDDHADLVRRRMGVGVDDLPRAGLVALGTDDDDVLAELGADVDAVLLEGVDRTGAVRMHGLQHLLRELLERLVLRDGLGLAADGDHRPRPALDPVADETLGRGAAGSLGDLRHALLAEQRARSVEIAARLLERALRVHHRRAGGVAKLLHLRCGNGRAHALSSSVVAVASAAGASSGAAAACSGTAGSSVVAVASAAGASSGAAAACSGSAGSSVVAAGSSVAAGVASVGAAASAAGSAAAPLPLPAISLGVTLLCPAAIPSAIAFTIRLQERIASSFPGMM